MYSTLVTPWWILLTIVINSQERSRDTEPERPTLGGHERHSPSSCAMDHPGHVVLKILLDCESSTLDKSVGTGSLAPRLWDCEEDMEHQAIQDLLMWSPNPGTESITLRMHTKNITTPRSHPHPDYIRRLTVVF